MFRRKCHPRRIPFYAESGGQVGDTGWLEPETGDSINVLDTTRDGDTIIHHCDPDSAADLKPGVTVTARVDAARRQSIMRNHTATHLLHAVLRETLGAHVEQRGSVVAPDRLRFDFSHFSRRNARRTERDRTPGQRARLGEHRRRTVRNRPGRREAPGRHGAFHGKVRGPGARGAHRRGEPGTVRRHPPRPPRARSGCSGWSGNRASPRACGGWRP